MVNIDIINWGILFDGSADEKLCYIPWLINFKLNFANLL